MILRNVYTIAALMVGGAACAADIVERAEATELRLSNGTIVSRVVRDDEGQVSILKLNDMTLSQDDLIALTKLEHLRALVLVQTNVTDEDLAHLKQCERLDHLNLTGTDVTDGAIDTILELTTLKSLCLGNVRITPRAVEKLKERNREQPRDRQLRWGYVQRRD